MSRTRDIQFANLVCKFGERNLLDFPDMVIEAFANQGRVRRFGDSSYMFGYVELCHHDIGGRHVACLSGRLIKNMKLKRQQLLKDGQLVTSYAEMSSSPSSFFCLILEDHRVAYVHETSYAPDLSAFRATLYKFLIQAWDEKIQSMYAEHEEGGRGGGEDYQESSQKRGAKAFFGNYAS